MGQLKGLGKGCVMRIIRITSSIFILIISITINTHAQRRAAPQASLSKEAVFTALERKMSALKGHLLATTAGEPAGAAVEMHGKKQSKASPSQPQLGGQSSPQVRRLVQESSDHVAYLRELSRANDVPTEYLWHLQLDVELLETIKDIDNPNQKDFVLIDTVASDLRVKSLFAFSQKRSRDNPFKLINVKAHTKKAGDEVSGCEVWYVPVGWADKPEKYQAFDQQSSPTDQMLPPSNYLMWARKDSKTGDKKPVTVGNDRKTEREIDLLAP
jgi:hypothetical protein